MNISSWKKERQNLINQKTVHCHSSITFVAGMSSTHALGLLLEVDLVGFAVRHVLGSQHRLVLGVLDSAHD